MTRRLLAPVLVMVLPLALGLVACGGDGAVACGQGTRLSGGKCVPVADALACGPGTRAEGGVCVAADAADGADVAVDTADAGPADTPLDVACVPACGGRQCGDDGCGGSCGACTELTAPVCNELGACVAACQPECTGKACGPDGCGGACGTCAAGKCSAFGQCVPAAWTCSALYFGAGDACDCGCGAADPDCLDGEAPVAGCGTLETCDDKGACVSTVPAGWTCLATAYGALDACDCGCGAVDPDCGLPSLPVAGCEAGETCSAAGTCAACTPACSGKTCGDDGCGGSCGTCGDGQVCDAGACVDPCKPAPVACKYANCGDDGCGGSCGGCGAGEVCDGGYCQAAALPEAPTSCVNHCGSTAPIGCACTPGCKAAGSCCDDYAAVCSCKPDCKGKTCGDDGCGGVCGTCGGDQPFCAATGTCVATCAKQCAGKACGPDGCGGSCGACGPDATCAWSGQCVPTAWQCPAGYYADGTACDCGCGAPDPDCADAKLATFGCPSATTACDAATGLCKVAFCKADAACPGQTCVGAYATGGGLYGGVCGAQTAGGKPAGQPCSSGGECASDVCLAGACRQYCQADGECPGSLKCLGLPVQGGSGAVVGFAGVCDAPKGSAATCAAQGDCKLLGESCQAFVHATTLQARFLCAVGSKVSGAACGLAKCAAGQLCVQDAKGAHCAAVCPAGDADCSSGKCGSTVLHNAGTVAPDDDPKVPACVQP